ncbi:hypothetical protein BDY21DRAFT_140262 [Lineolata rhizophorae]|uniref:Uncharacterized protein n=1 Tax=Lineolata rhizophorae TaxID=578093 RepID=A0A6A6PB75_9PEZI|nr:hypothetical protein BDY21DRAFT_140262 [Lineolata rhizophorae]
MAPITSHRFGDASETTGREDGEGLAVWTTRSPRSGPAARASSSRAREMPRSNLTSEADGALARALPPRSLRSACRGAVMQMHGRNTARCGAGGLSRTSRVRTRPTASSRPLREPACGGGGGWAVGWTRPGGAEMGREGLLGWGRAETRAGKGRGLFCGALPPLARGGRASARKRDFWSLVRALSRALALMERGDWSAEVLFFFA